VVEPCASEAIDGIRLATMWTWLPNATITICFSRLSSARWAWASEMTANGRTRDVVIRRSP
jgi:hypothetical protein